MVALAGYSVYPQINIDVNNIFNVQLFTMDGELKFEDIGVGRTQEEARTKAKELAEKEMSQYIINEGE